MARKFIAFAALQALVVTAVDLPAPRGVMRLVSRVTYPSSCQFIPDVLDACESAIPGFDNFDDTLQAECFCYNSQQQWVPDRFDGSVSACADFLSTADTSYYSTFTVLEGFCRSVGNVLSAAGSGASVSTPATRTSSATGGSISPIRTTPAPTITPATGLITLSTVPACSGAIDIVNSCSDTVQGFTNLNDAQQASCVCYSSSTWVPDVFDKDVQSCASYVKTAAPSAYSVYSGLTNYCSSIGDVLNGQGAATTTSSRVTTSLRTNQTPTATTVVVVTPSTTTAAGGAGSKGVQGGVVQNLFLGFLGLTVGGLAWL